MSWYLIKVKETISDNKQRKYEHYLNLLKILFFPIVFPANLIIFLATNRCAYFSVISWFGWSFEKSFSTTKWHYIEKGGRNE